MINQIRPNPIVYFLASTMAKIQCYLFHHIKLEGVVPQGPALILANHASFEDFKFISCACKMNRVTFLCTYHFFTFKVLGLFLKIVGAIPKYQFTTDIESMKRIKSVVQKGGIVYIAPEGTVYANGKLGYISPSIAKMVRFLKVPVYSCKIEGPGLGCAKWSKHKHSDYVHVETKLLLTEKQAVESELNQNYLTIVDALQYNEFEYQKKNNILIKGKDKAEGFETMFYKCPNCGKEFTLKTNGNVIECTNCKISVEIKDNFNFEWKGNKQFFDNYIQWYDWQYQCMKDEINKPDFILEDEVDYAIDKPGVNNYIKVGHGILTLSKEGWNYKGTFEQQEISEHDDLESVFLATLKCGLHFELPYKYGHCRVYYPQNGNRAMKWHLASRAYTELLAQK